MKTNLRRDVPICVILIVGLTYLFRPVFASDGLRPQTVVCLSNVKQSALGLTMYANDENDRLPSRDAWMDATYPYMKTETAWHCPSVPSGAYGYAFNGALSRAKIPPEGQAASVPLVYDSVNPIRNASDLCASLPLLGRHGGGNNVAYADGHARRVPARSAGFSPHSDPGLQSGRRTAS